jgi:UDP-N-acetylmuramoyl-tripeptide--D-alanyl-D-alanine ligase
VIPVSLRELLEAADPEVFGSLPADAEFGKIERNSKEVLPGDLFIAVKGERFDAHQFVDDAAAHGATAALVRRDWAEEHQTTAPIPLLGVADPVEALQKVAHARRKRLNPTVVGITGSVGKSSTKEVVASVLSQRFKTYRNPGNMNSEIGLPVSLLEVDPGTEVAVLEMGGAYAFGEVALLAEIALPNVAVVTNIHPVHLSRMGTIEAIAATKAELVAAIPPDGVVVLNGDDHRVRAMAAVSRARVITYGHGEDNDFRADQVQTRGLEGTSFRLTFDGARYDVTTRLIGGHAPQLALAALAVGHGLGMSIPEMLTALETQKAQIRLLLVPGPRGSRLIDDTYNASTPSVLSALGVLSEIEAKRKIAVLGDMRELGDVTEQEHRVVGRRVTDVVDRLFTYGELARTFADEARATRPDLAIDSFGVDQKDELVDILLETLQEGDAVLLKGSRGLEMERIVAALRAATEPATPSAGERQA